MQVSNGMSLSSNQKNYRIMPMISAASSSKSPRLVLARPFCKGHENTLDSAPKGLRILIFRNFLSPAATNTLLLTSGFDVSEPLAFVATWFVETGMIKDKMT